MCTAYLVFRLHSVQSNGQETFIAPGSQVWKTRAAKSDIVSMNIKFDNITRVWV